MIKLFQKCTTFLPFFSMGATNRNIVSMSEWAFRTLVAMTREVANPLIDVGAFLEACMPIDMDRSRILCDLQEGKLLFCVSIAINTVSLYSRFAPFRKSRFAPQAQ